MHDLVRFTFGLHSYPMVLANENNLKAARGKHSRKFPFAFTDGQSLFCFIAMERNRGVRSFFVVVAIVLVLVSREITVRSAIDAQFPGIFRFLRGPSPLRLHRH